MSTAWKVIYNDKSSLKQFNEDGTENSFSAIKQDDIFEFCVYHNGKIVSLFMPTGTFGFNGFLYDTDMSSIPNMKYRLLNFVRRRKVMGQGENKDIYFIGFQITKEGKNYKRMVSICENQIQLVND